MLDFEHKSKSVKREKTLAYTFEKKRCIHIMLKQCRIPHLFFFTPYFFYYICEIWDAEDGRIQC